MRRRGASASPRSTSRTGSRRVTSRDSTIDGVRFDETEIGKALRIADSSNATDLYRFDPVSLVLGAWNSQRKGRQPKFARCYRSEVIGLDHERDFRRGGRLDPLNLTGAIDDKEKREGDWQYISDGEKKKGGKLSEIGHGNALGGDNAPGGVTVTEARRLGGLSFAALARLKFGDANRDAVVACRTALAALALAGDRLAFGAAGWVFRSGCELTVVSDELAWEGRGGVTEPFDLTASEAIELFDLAADRATSAGLTMSTDTVAIEPIDGLRKAIEHALVAAARSDRCSPSRSRCVSACTTPAARSTRRRVSGRRPRPGCSAPSSWAIPTTTSGRPCAGSNASRSRRCTAARASTPPTTRQFVITNEVKASSPLRPGRTAGLAQEAVGLSRGRLLRARLAGERPG